MPANALRAVVHICLFGCVVHVDDCFGGALVSNCCALRAAYVSCHCCWVVASCATDTSRCCCCFNAAVVDGATAYVQPRRTQPKAQQHTLIRIRRGTRTCGVRTRTGCKNWGAYEEQRYVIHVVLRHISYEPVPVVVWPNIQDEVCDSPVGIVLGNIVYESVY